MEEKVKLWMRNPVDCVQMLIGNPAYDGHIAYAPERVYADKEGTERIYNEMWTADWHYEIQVSTHTKAYQLSVYLTQK